jgi:DNA-binding IclR family transcriptional regulator
MGGIQSLDAALRVLTILSESGKALSLTELSRMCEMQPTKTHRYLASFVHAGLVHQNGKSGTYNLGQGSIELGLSAMARHDFVNSVADALPALTEQTGLTALLCVWGNSGPTVIRWERATSFIVTSLGLGTTLPLLSSATGQVALAFLPENVTKMQLEKELKAARKNKQMIDGIQPNKINIKAVSAKVHEAGFAAVDGRFIPGLQAIAAPILDWQNNAQAIVTLIGNEANAINSSSGVQTSLLDFCKSLSVQNPTRKP